MPTSDELACDPRESLLVGRALALFGMPARVEPLRAAEGLPLLRAEGRLSAVLFLPDGRGLLVCPEDRTPLDGSRIETWSRALDIIEALTCLGSPPRLGTKESDSESHAPWHGSRGLCGEAILAVHRCLHAARIEEQVGLTALHLGDWLSHLPAGQRLDRAQAMLATFLPRCRTVCLDAHRLLVVEAPANATRERECVRTLLLADAAPPDKDAAPILACGTLAGPVERNASATGLIEGVLADLELMRAQPAPDHAATADRHAAWVLVLEPRGSVAEAIRWCMANADEVLAVADLAGADLLLDRRATAPVAAFLATSLEATPAPAIGCWVDSRLPRNTPVVWICARLDERLPALATPRPARQLVKPFDAPAMARAAAGLFPRTRAPGGNGP